MNIQIEITERELKKLVREYITKLMGDVMFQENDIKIMVKTTQNYKADWEEGQFKANISKVIL